MGEGEGEGDMVFDFLRVHHFSVMVIHLEREGVSI